MIYLFLASGFEEAEAITTVDILRRADIEVKTVSVEDKIVTGSHGVPVVCDLCVEDARYDNMTGIVLPGGPGVANLKKSEALRDLVRYAYDNGLLLAAICAAPTILGEWGYLKDKRAVCYPGEEEKLIGAKIEAGAVIQDGNIITGKGPGAVVDFAFVVAKALTDSKKVDQVKQLFMAGL